MQRERSCLRGSCLAEGVGRGGQKGNQSSRGGRAVKGTLSVFKESGFLFFLLDILTFTATKYSKYSDPALHFHEITVWVSGG